MLERGGEAGGDRAPCTPAGCIPLLRRKPRRLSIRREREFAEKQPDGGRRSKGLDLPFPFFIRAGGLG
jgi:hypothetical protein